MHAPSSLLALTAGLLLAPAALATDPVASGTLDCAADGTLAWTASGTDADSDLIELIARIYCYPTLDDCVNDTNLSKVIKVSDKSATSGMPSLSSEGSVACTEGSYYILEVRAVDVPGVTKIATTLCCKCTPAADEQVSIGEGDLLPEVGIVTSISNLAVDNDGNTMVEVDTDNPDTNIDGALVLNTSLALREGDPLALPPGALLDSFDAVTLNTSLHSAWNFFLDGTSGTNDDSGVYFGTNLLLQEGTVSSAPQLSPGSVFQGFFECKLNENDRIVVLATVDDIALPTSVDQAFFSLQVDGEGNLASEDVLYKEGDTLAGQTETVEDFETGPHNFAYNDNNELIFVADMTGDTTQDMVVYLDNTLLAQEGSPSPVAGRTWSSLSGAEVDLNTVGDWVVSGSLDGDSTTNLLIVKNGAKLVQEGDVLPGTNGFGITSFGSGPVLVGDNGNVLWFGDWSDPDTTRDTGLFLNDQLLVQEGVTTVNGFVIDDLRGITDGYTMSPDGDWVLFEANLVGGIEVAVRYHIGPWTYLGHGLAGTGAKTPVLLGKGSLQGDALTRLELSNALPNTTTAFVIGITELSASFKGGTMVPHPDVVFLGLPVDAAGELTIGFPFPSGAPAGIPLWFQYWPSDPGGLYGFSASNAVKATTP